MQSVENSSSLLRSIGLGNADIGIFILVLMVLLLILIAVGVILIVKMDRLKKRLDKFMLGKDGISLEKDILTLFEDNKYFKKVCDRHKRDLKTLFQKMETAYQKMGLVKYDAFQQMGGQLSFSLALLNERNDGFIINSVHSSDGCYSYTKEIRGGACDLALGREEAQALAIAMGEQKE